MVEGHWRVNPKVSRTNPEQERGEAKQPEYSAFLAVFWPAGVGVRRWGREILKLKGSFAVHGQG
jgi:hypothetical protein